jgi:hypothetical protein
LTVAIHSQVEKGVRRLRNMGLKVSVTPVNDNVALIFITIQSIKEVIAKLVRQQIKFPNVEIKYEEPFMVIKVWKA